MLKSTSEKSRHKQSKKHEQPQARDREGAESSSEQRKKSTSEKYIASLAGDKDYVKTVW